MNSASASSACVELARDGAAVLVRDSKNRPGPLLEFTDSKWMAFLSEVRT